VRNNVKSERELLHSSFNTTMRILQSCVTPFIFIAFSLCHRLATANDDEHREFWDACAHGDLEIVSKYIRQDPGGLDAYDMYFKKKIREYFVE